MTALPLSPAPLDAGAPPPHRAPHLHVLPGGATDRPLPRAQRAAWLVDAPWPELESYVLSRRRRADVLGVPLLAQGEERWGAEGFARVHGSSLLGFLRGRDLADVAHLPAARLRVRFKYDDLIARSFIPLLGRDVPEVTVSQNLLPALWRSGALRGRAVDVLMVRLPLHVLHARLDQAARLHPLSLSLATYRAPDDVVDDEAEALAAARRVVTPHSEIAALFPGRALKIPWVLPDAGRHRPGPRVVLAGRTDGLQGVYELRDAACHRNAALTTLEPPREYLSFWRGMDVRRRPVRDAFLDAAVAVLPAWCCSRPGAALAAVACGVPVVATAAAGLAGVPGVRELPVGDAVALAAALPG
ncbi:MAG: glycosyltransferase family 4 protein [Deltaproteobacteria bacterium]|nr:glycosyltransferase family 4 protein [Deltaproteobacteria bacterium]